MVIKAMRTIQGLTTSKKVKYQTIYERYGNKSIQRAEAQLVYFAAKWPHNALVIMTHEFMKAVDPNSTVEMRMKEPKDIQS